MRKSFNLPAIDFAALSEPRILVRAALGTLFLANLVAAAFAFHWLDDSPDTVGRQLIAAEASQAVERGKLLKTRSLAANIARGKADGENFIATSMTSRRRTYSTILGDITEMAKVAGMKSPSGTINLEPVAGSDDLDLMSISFTFDGGYAELLKFVNLLDRSPRFLIIESLTVTPRVQTGTLAVTLRVDTFVREDAPPAKAGAL